MLSGTVHRHRRRRCRRHHHRQYHQHHHHYHHRHPTLSGTVLIFTGLRIRATLRRLQSVQIRLHQNTSQRQTPADDDGQQPAASQKDRRLNAAGSRRTINIITYASVAFFVFWSPYVVVLMVQCFVDSFKPPPAVEFAVMWIANTNSAINVFIYSSTNTQFRRQCILLVSRLCCFRLSHPRSSKMTQAVNVQVTGLFVSLLFLMILSFVTDVYVLASST